MEIFTELLVSELILVRRLLTKYSFLALPVVDEAGKLFGIITVDDVLSLPVNTRGLRM